MNDGIDRVKQVLLQHGKVDRLQELDSSTHTAQQAAEALGVLIGQIAKSIVFVRVESGLPVVVITRGDLRVSERAVGDAIGEQIKRAHPDWVREHTGYPIGGVSPLGHLREVRVVLDAALWKYSLVYAAAGHQKTVFSASPDEIREMTGADVFDGISE